METAIEFQQRQDELIGDKAIKNIQGRLAQGDSFKTEDLSELAMAVDALYRRIAIAETVLKRTVEKVKATANERIKNMDESLTLMLSHAERIMAEEGTKKIQIDGFGQFHFRKDSPKCDHAVYDTMPEPEQNAIHAKWPQYFVKKTTISADLTAIRKAIEAGEQIDGFHVPEQGYGFHFKQE